MTLLRRTFVEAVPARIPATPASLAASVLAALALFTCSPADDDGSRVEPGAVTATDSAGVEIVRIGRDVLASAPPLRLVEELRIGTRDGPEEAQFFRIASVRQGADGEIWVLDSGDHLVRVFGPDGTLLRAFGREGEGPGEFRFPGALRIRKDTVVVTEYSRLSFFDREGRFLGTGPDFSRDEVRGMGTAEPTAAGWMAAWSTRLSAVMPKGQPYRDTTTVYRIEVATGERLHPVLRYPQAETRLLGQISFFVPPYFASNPHHEIAPDGTVFFTPGDAYRIDVRDPDGRLVRRVVADLDPLPVTDAMVDEAVGMDRDRRRDAAPGSESAMVLEILDDKAAISRGRTLPVLGRMYASPSGRLLVRRMDLDEDPLRDGDPVHWDLFDPSGRLEGRLTLPVGTRVMQLTDEGLLAIERDELDVPSVVRYRLEVGSRG